MGHLAAVCNEIVATQIAIKIPSPSLKRPFHIFLKELPIFVHHRIVKVHLKMSKFATKWAKRGQQYFVGNFRKVFQKTWISKGCVGRFHWKEVMSLEFSWVQDYSGSAAVLSVSPAAEKQTGPFQNLTFEGFFARTQWNSSLYQVMHICFRTFCKICGQTEQYDSKAKIFNILQNTVILGNRPRKVVCNNIKAN